MEAKEEIADINQCPLIMVFWKEPKNSNIITQIQDMCTNILFHWCNHKVQSHTYRMSNPTYSKFQPSSVQLNHIQLSQTYSEWYC